MQNESDSNNRQSKDLEKERQGVSRINSVHGGELVELIQPENIRPDYDVNCQHKNKSLDNSGDFDEVMCKDCPMVWVFKKGTFVV